MINLFSLTCVQNIYVSVNLSFSDPVLDLSSSFGGSKPVNLFLSKFLQKYTQKAYEYHLLYTPLSINEINGRDDMTYNSVKLGK